VPNPFIAVSRMKLLYHSNFITYDWPGNMRELQNVVERAVILAEGDTFFVAIQNYLLCQIFRKS
jgi:DNA-binding NtrC family response regulator